MRVDRSRIRRRPLMHPLMEAFVEDVSAKGRQHVREKASRLDPLESWCREHAIDPAQATGDELKRFRQWLWGEWRIADGSEPAFNTKRHSLGMARMWYRWLAQAGHRESDPGHEVLALNPSGNKPVARYIHTPLHPLMEAHIEYHRLRGRKATAYCVDLIMRQFSAWCLANGIDPLRLTREQANEFLVWLSTKARTPSGTSLARGTISQRIAFLKSWYDWMEVRGDIISNPASKLRVRVVQSRVVVRQHLTLQEAIAVVQTQAQFVIDAPTSTVTWARRMRTLAAICIGLATGRRIGGLLHIQVADIDCERRELRVEREKGRVGRVLPVSEWAIAIVRVYIRDARKLLALGESPWLFVGLEGTAAMTTQSAASALDDVVKRTIAANPDLDDLSRKRITWHSLRVTFATMLFSNGCPIRSVNELMLHTCLSTTAKYTPIPIEDMHKIWRSAHPRP